MNKHQKYKSSFILQHAVRKRKKITGKGIRYYILMNYTYIYLQKLSDEYIMRQEKGTEMRQAAPGYRLKLKGRKEKLRDIT